MKKVLRQDAVLTIPIYQSEIVPEEGDRVYFNNFDEVFTVEKVSPALDEEMLIKEHQMSELTLPYLNGFFDLALVPLYDDYDIIGLRGLIDGGDYEEVGVVAGDAYFLLSKFETELKLAEAESEGKNKLSSIDRIAIAIEAKETIAQTFYGDMLPSLFNKSYEATGDGQMFKVEYDPVVAYLDGYMPVAVMVYYSEHAVDGQFLEQIPAAYVDWELAQDCGLTVEDVQYLVEELFYETLGDFDPETAGVLLETPTIMIPASQAPFYEGLIDSNGWKDTGDVGWFGYKIFN